MVAVCVLYNIYLMNENDIEDFLGEGEDGCDNGDDDDDDGLFFFFEM